MQNEIEEFIDELLKPNIPNNDLELVFNHQNKASLKDISQKEIHLGCGLSSEDISIMTGHNRKWLTMLKSQQRPTYNFIYQICYLNQINLVSGIYLYQYNCSKMLALLGEVMSLIDGIIKPSQVSIVLFKGDSLFKGVKSKCYTSEVAFVFLHAYKSILGYTQECINYGIKIGLDMNEYTMRLKKLKEKIWLN